MRQEQAALSAKQAPDMSGLAFVTLAGRRSQQELSRDFYLCGDGVYV